MIVSAHLGHWYSAFGFLVPAVLVVLWIRYQARRDRRRQEFAQYWTLELRGADWTVVEIEPAPASRRQWRAKVQLVPPPWSAAEGAEAQAVAAMMATIQGQEGSPPASNGHSG
jgi:hypothetical protein